MRLQSKDSHNYIRGIPSTAARSSLLEHLRVKAMAVEERLLLVRAEARPLRAKVRCLLCHMDRGADQLTAIVGTGATGAVAAGGANAGATNAGTANAGTANAGTANAGTANAGTANAGTANAGTTNAGTANAGVANAGAAKAAKGKGKGWLLCISQGYRTLK
jgi:PPE-repeat protein